MLFTSPISIIIGLLNAKQVKLNKEGSGHGGGDAIVLERRDHKMFFSLTLNLLESAGPF